MDIPKLNESKETKKLPRIKEPINRNKVITFLILGVIIVIMFRCTTLYLTEQLQSWNSQHGFQSPVIFRSPIYNKETKQDEKPVSMIKTVEAKEPYCFDVQSCIRDIGEEMGFSNKDIMIAMQISKNESGYNAGAINKNSNGTFDIGAFQINDVHNKRISREDRMDYQKNIRFAYTLRKEQGNWNAWSTCHNGKVNCSL